MADRGDSNESLNDHAQSPLSHVALPQYSDQATLIHTGLKLGGVMKSVPPRGSGWIDWSNESLKYPGRLQSLIIVDEDLYVIDPPATARWY